MSLLFQPHFHSEAAAIARLEGDCLAARAILSALWGL